MQRGRLKNLWSRGDDNWRAELKGDIQIGTDDIVQKIRASHIDVIKNGTAELLSQPESQACSTKEAVGIGRAGFVVECGSLTSIQSGGNGGRLG